MATTVEALNRLLNSEEGAIRARLEQTRAIQYQTALRLQEQNSLINLRNRGAIRTVRTLSDSSQVAAIRRASRAAEFAQQSEILAQQGGSVGGGISRPSTDPSGLRMPGSNPAGGAPAPMGRSPIAVPGSAPSPGRLPGLRIPPGLGRLGQGLGGLGAGLSAIGEGHRLGQLIADPAEYWRGQDREMREQYPFLYPPSAQPGFGGIPRSALPIVPFSGGQTPGILYRVTVNYTYPVGNPPTPLTDSIVMTVTGPVGGISTTTEGGQKTWNLQTGTGPIFVLSTDAEAPFSSAGIGQIQREDGQPDEGGDPPPVLDPDAPQRPSLAPPNAPFSPPAPAALPGAVPFNNPQLRPTPGTLPPQSNAPLPNPFASPAPAPNPAPTPRALPSPRPGAPPAEPGPGQNPANPNGGDLQDSANRRSPDLLSAAIMGGTLLIGERLTNRAPTPQPAPGSGSGTGTGTPQVPTPFCRFRDDPYSPQINARTAEMRGIELAIQGYQQSMLSKLDEKLGPQIPGGGIAGKLGKLGQMASKTWNFLQVDRVLAVLSWIGILHNAFMLSNNIGQTLFSAISASLDAIGIQKTDENGNEEPYDVGQIVGQWTDSYAKSIFGVDNWTNMKKEWKKLNRIYQSAANLLFSIQSITFSMTEMLEVVSNYTGKIGNSLKRSGTILQNSFAWMNPSANYTNNRFFNALNNAQQTAEVIEQVSSNVVDIQQQGADLADRKSEFEKAMADQTKAVEDKEKASVTASTRPNIPINPADERKAEP